MTVRDTRKKHRWSSSSPHTSGTRDRSLERPTDEISAPCIFLIFQIHRKNRNPLCSTQISLVIMKIFRVVSRARTHGMISACTCVISHWHSHPIIGRARKDFNRPNRAEREWNFFFSVDMQQIVAIIRESRHGQWKIRRETIDSRKKFPLPRTLQHRWLSMHVMKWPKKIASAM